MAAVFSLTLAAFAFPASASPVTPLPPVATGNVVTYTLYGSALSGWGFNATTITDPGPALNASYGDTVQLTLISTDLASTDHNWFIDYNNNSFVDAGEPSSPLFSAGNAIVWNFTADHIGTFVYRCKVHPGTMKGLITITAPTHYTLYGSVVGKVGWGLNATNISAPGPTIIIAAGTNITLTLYSADNVDHTWFIDFNNDSQAGAGEPQSPDFGGGNPNPVNFTFETNTTGTYLYRCGKHPSQMWGMIIIVGQGASVPAGFPIGLIPGIMLVVIGGVLILAVVYQVRATRAARMKR